MQRSTEAKRSRGFCVTVCFLMLMVMIGSLPNVAPAQVNISEPNLHDGDIVFGVQASSPPIPFVNSQDILLEAWGASDPNLYNDVSFFVFGLGGDVNCVNTGTIDVNAVGGNALTQSLTSVSAHIYASGIYVTNDINNVGDVNVAIQGGTVDVNNVDDTADAHAMAYGIYSAYGSMVNSGAIDVLATGGTALVDSGGNFSAVNDIIVAAHAYGLYSDNERIDNTGDINVMARGGIAEANDVDAFVDAKAKAYGIYAMQGPISNEGRVNVQAVGGTAATGATMGISEYNETTASARGYGLYTDDGWIDNTGDVNVVAIGGIARASVVNTPHEILAQAYAYGIKLGDEMYSGTLDRYVNNSGNITLTAIGGNASGSCDHASASAYAYGIEVEDFEVENNGPITNSGTLTITAIGGRALSSRDTGINDSAGALATAYGIESPDTGVDNSGAVTVTAIGGIATGQGTAYATARAEATGIYAEIDEESSEPGEVRNTEAITVTAIAGQATSLVSNANAYTTAYGVNTDNLDVNNTGDITVVAQSGMATTEGHARTEVTAGGLQAFHGDVNNTGDIIVTAIAGTAEGGDVGDPDDDFSVGANAEVMAYGLSVYQGDVNNTGDVTVTAFAGTATGKDAEAYSYAVGISVMDGNLYNSGDVNVIVEGGEATDGDAGTAFTSVGGIDIMEGTLTNTGDVTVMIDGGVAGTNGSAETQADGITAYRADVNNSGNITVAATAQDGLLAKAYGISFYGTGTLTNTGIVRATGDEAYELYVNSGTTTIVDTYNITLDNDPCDASIYVAPEAMLVLDDPILTVTGINGVTTWDTPYPIFNADPNSVTGDFNDVQAVNPDTSVTYYDQGTANSSDDTVSLSYDPKASEVTGSVAVEKQMVTQSMGVVHHRMTSTLLNNILYPSNQGLLVDAGPIGKSMGLANSAEGPERSGVFVEPYYSRMEQDADPLGYDARIWGFAAGYERQLDETLISLYAGYGQADIDYTGTGYSGNSEDQDILSGGITGLTRLNDWTLRYGVTGFYGWHDYEGLTGEGLTDTETASIDSYGVIASAMVGHIFQRGSQILMPEIGLNYLWGHRDRYTTEASNPAYDTTYSAMNDHDVEAEAALHWMTGFMHGNIHVSPAVSVGIRHLLTDDESIVRQSVPGRVASVKSERDRTAMTFSGSVALSKSNHALSVAYDGEYSDNTDRHSVWLRYGWQF